MVFDIKLEIDIPVHNNGKDIFRVYVVDTPYRTIRGEGKTLHEAMVDFDYNYVMAKEKHDESV